MDAVEFLKAKNRMCRECGYLPGDCFVCPIGNDSGGCQAGVLENQKVTEEILVQIVEKWAAEHPRKTRQSEFLKMFPNAALDNGTIRTCPQLIEGEDNYNCIYDNGIPSCINCCKRYWLAEVE